MAKPGFDPEHARLVEPDATGVRIPDRLLTPDALRAVFATERIRTETAPAANLIPAAVLVALIQRPTGLTVLFTRRTAHLNDHAGQISFPGGRTDPEDASPIETALREAREEVGLATSAVEVIGQLPRHDTSTGFVVTPVVALVESVEAFTPQPFEVAEVFETPLHFLMDPRNHELRELAWDEGGVRMARRFHAMPWHNDGARYFIWGATATMLHGFYSVLAAELARGAA
ncbi:CoA pyrophosphatase [Derxia lacustris]|uniref:CoA pyrophosphatase n=1 Tax=Derxia lacustris TaxID=764842 RepID=UPI000A1729FD|nr:CoA pyrophosphatase [Derxia lacustris]